MKGGAPGGGPIPFADVSNQLQAAAAQQQLEQQAASGAAAGEGPNSSPSATEAWLIGSSAAPQAPPSSAKPAQALQAAAGAAGGALHTPFFSRSPYAAPAAGAPPSAQLVTPAGGAGSVGAAVATLQPKPPAEAPHPIVKVAPVHPVEVPDVGERDGPLVVRCPAASVHPRPPIAVPSNLPNNVPDHIAVALAAGPVRPQTAVGSAHRAAAKAAADPRRPATGSGLSQRSLTAKKGVQVVRGAAAGGEQPADALRRSVASTPTKRQ